MVAKKNSRYETKAQQHKRQQNDAKRKQIKRKQENKIQRKNRLNKKKNENKKQRLKETINQKSKRLKIEKEKLAVKKQNNKNEMLNAAFNYDKNCNYKLYEHTYIGKMNHVCEYCRALKFQKETKSMCCSNGKVSLMPMKAPPEPLLEYISGDSSTSKHFIQNIRKYNSSFQMTSFGATKIFKEGFMPTFKVQGQIYHNIGSLMPIEKNTEKFLQIYFMGDSEKEKSKRLEYSNELRHEIISNLQEILHKHNKLVKIFKYAIEKLPEKEYQIVLKADKIPDGYHKKRFNEPLVDEIAVIMVGDECDGRDIIINERNGTLQRVRESHRSYDALQYPIIFWNGEDGYHFNITQTNSTKKVIKKSLEYNFNHQKYINQKKFSFINE